MNYRRGMQVARAASMLSNASRRARRVGAALFAGNRLLSIGYNTFGCTHPRAQKYCNVHAEQRCLLRRQYYENNGRLRIFVYRELASGQPACSKPCLNCIGLLKEAGVHLALYMDAAGTFVEVPL